MEENKVVEMTAEQISEVIEETAKMGTLNINHKWDKKDSIKTGIICGVMMGASGGLVYLLMEKPGGALLDKWLAKHEEKAAKRAAKKEAKKAKKNQENNDDGTVDDDDFFEE